MDGARRQFAEIYAGPLILATYLKIGIVVAVLFCAGLLALNFRTEARVANAKPIVIRIDDVGRAEAVTFDTATEFELQDRNVKHYLARFVVLHYARVRRTVTRDFPDSLFFLSDRIPETGGQSLLQQTIAERTVERYLKDPALEEVDVEVKNVIVPELTPPVYRADVDFRKDFYTSGSSQPVRTETWVAHVQFRVRLSEGVPNTFIPVNPLGFEIESIRLDQAFR